MSGLPIEKMKDELESFQTFVHDSEKLTKAGETNDSKRVTQQLIEAAFLLEDMIDRYIMIGEKEESESAISICTALLSCEIANFIQTMLLRCQLKYRFEDFRKQFHRIRDSNLRRQEGVSIADQNISDISDVREDQNISDLSQATPIIRSNLSQDPPCIRSTGITVSSSSSAKKRRAAPRRKKYMTSDHSHADDHSLPNGPNIVEVSSLEDDKDELPCDSEPCLRQLVFSEDQIISNFSHAPNAHPILVSSESQNIIDLNAHPIKVSRESQNIIHLSHAPNTDPILLSSEHQNIIDLSPAPNALPILVSSESQNMWDLSPADHFPINIVCSVPQNMRDVSHADHSPTIQEDREDDKALPLDLEPCLQQYREDPLPHYKKEEDTVGFDVPCAELIRWLVYGSPLHTAITVVGMGGQGKTTLAKKVFNSRKVTEYFVRAWILVSQSDPIEQLLRKMLLEFYKQTKEFPPPEATPQMNKEQLIEVLNAHLQRKRYVVFFDGVQDPKYLDQIKSILVENVKGSRIFITTRSIDVAKHCQSVWNTKVHRLKALNNKESLDLLYKKALESSFKGGIPEPLQDISCEIVEKCNGLPLAIVSVGSVLSEKAKTTKEWRRFKQNLSSELHKNPQLSNITAVFSQAHDDLPDSVKYCLLYFAIYPEDYEVKSNRLIRQWIAEGFVKKEKSEKKTLEEVAEGYLKQLIDTNLVQESSIGFDGTTKGCRVHDLVRMTILRKVDDLRFCRFITGETESSSFTGIIRRLSIATTCIDLMKNIDGPRIRSIHFFIEGELPEKFVSSIPTTYKMLKLLDFENARSCPIPENFGAMIYLKYLSFRNTVMQQLPKSIGEMENLETLDVRQTGVNELPAEVGKLKKLRHLLGDEMSLIKLKDCIGDMTSLQTLSEAAIDEDGVELIRELGKLTELRELSLIDVNEEHGIALCSSINKMLCMEKLYIETKSKDAIIDLSVVSGLPMLQKLRLKAKLIDLPKWIPQLEKLFELSLSYSELSEDPLESLKDLPNLLLLNLAVKSYEGECLHFQENGFQKLKGLDLKYLHNLNSIILDEGALPCLEELTFMNIPNLKEAPSRIYHLEKLRVLNSHFMPNEFDVNIAPLIKDKKL